MTETSVPSPDAVGSVQKVYDVIIVGAGITGLYQLHVLRQRGLTVRVLEAGGGIGGTWYWNRYPGCRLDSESYTYQYVFDEELLAEAKWTELFAGQPEIERYVNGFADRFDLRRDVQLETRVESMVFDEGRNTWTLHTAGGEDFTTRFVLAATGILSAPNYPALPGIENFEGELYHTATWPHEPVDFAGKRVAVIGTGASGVQIIPRIAESAAQLTVFQRTPNWAVPLRNRPIDDAEMEEIRKGYPELFEKLRASSNGFVHDWDPTPYSSVSEEDRLAQYEELWQRPGFAKWFGTYREIATTPEANSTYSAFVEQKIRERVHDQSVADDLVPTDHPFGTKRVPCETDYYETYNRDNVRLVPLAKNPLVEYTRTGLRTAEGEMNFDIIVLATGFDAFTGALSRIDIRGTGGQTLKDKWRDGPQTYMGIQVSGFPNLLINGGPHGKGGIGNSPRCAEPLVWWLGGLLGYMREHGYTRIEADAEAEKKWTADVNELASKTMASKVKSYSFGDNIPGKPHVYVAYAGTLPDFIRQLEETAAEGYEGFSLS
ncbi:flavin-containing monooxygenase [Actinomadura bangladeshensis]|uniref:NAD(P)/FAD-dependent oxidoreductase n=1 Tax=Actinomadura bangladeshensis TaxID=453573 RepID=A0A4R4PEU9_9ACTN|nr:NAD(P)/FAD-dependent oxidoreductase [Actinomadura bangladeshensis]TDC20367.1 NAD(P)/FAD-dependent oxidoreductase [Actinomadura bangladeshensis]